jgi:hypothetical protein
MCCPRSHEPRSIQLEVTIEGRPNDTCLAAGPSNNNWVCKSTRWRPMTGFSGHLKSEKTTLVTYSIKKITCLRTLWLSSTSERCNHPLMENIQITGCIVLVQGGWYVLNWSACPVGRLPPVSAWQMRKRRTDTEDPLNHGILQENASFFSPFTKCAYLDGLHHSNYALYNVWAHAKQNYTSIV